MKILILGATGRTGKWVLKEALQASYGVNCLARNSRRIKQQPSLTIFEGNPCKKEDLEQALQGCSAVISVLNISRTSDFPWSPLRTPPDYLSEVMTTLIPMLEQRNIQRLVVCSAWGVGETRKDIPFWFRWLIDSSNIGKAYQDHEKQEQLLTNSSVPWTIVRPVGLTNFGKKNHLKESFNNNPRPNLTISRKTLAHYLVQCLSNNNIQGKKVVVSNL